MATEAACKLWFPAAARAARPAAPSLRILCFHNAGSAESTYTAPNVARGKRTPNELIAWAASLPTRPFPPAPFLPLPGR